MRWEERERKRERERDREREKERKQARKERGQGSARIAEKQGGFMRIYSKNIDIDMYLCVTI